MRFTITYHHTTEDGFRIYCLEDTSKKEYNDGRIIIYAVEEWCEQLRTKLIKEAKEPKYIQERLIL